MPRRILLGSAVLLQAAYINTLICMVDGPLMLQQEIQMSLTCDAALQGQENEGTNPDPGPWPQEICLQDCACSSQQRRQHPQRCLLPHLVAHSNPEAAEGA